MKGLILLFSFTSFGASYYCTETSNDRLLGEYLLSFETNFESASIFEKIEGAYRLRGTSQAIERNGDNLKFNTENKSPIPWDLDPFSQRCFYYRMAYEVNFKFETAKISFLPKLFKNPEIPNCAIPMLRPRPPAELSCQKTEIIPH